MGIQIEFNPELCLRPYEFTKEGLQRDECIPEYLVEGMAYYFLKNDHRFYYMKGPVPLCTTRGYGNLSRPIASVMILSVTHKYDIAKHHAYTTGTYRIVEVFPEDYIVPKFEGFERYMGAE